MVRARNREVERQQQQALWQAWHVAALIRSKRLPPLRRVLNPIQPARRISEADARVRRAELADLTARAIASGLRVEQGT